MTDKEFDKILKGKLEDNQPEYDQASWEALENRIVSEDLSSADDPFDDAVRAALGQFAVSDSIGDWTEMERRIVEDENSVFDHEVRQNVENYEAPYDAGSWPVLDQKITEDLRFRRRLIGAKILEIAAILIALITFYNVFPDIKNSLRDKGQSAEIAESPGTRVEGAAIMSLAQNSNGQASVLDAVWNKSEVTEGGDGSDVVLSSMTFPSNSGNSHSKASGPEPVANNEALLPDDRSMPEVQREDEVKVVYAIDLAQRGSTQVDNAQAENNKRRITALEYALQPYQNHSVHSISIEKLPSVDVFGIVGQSDQNITVTIPEQKPSKKRKALRFSFGASIDLNALYMAKEQFYADGKQIEFSEKNLLATGYSAGAGILFGDGPWTFETGLYYSAKEYDPDRILQVGKTFDVRTVDFSEISLHIVSVPLYAHWNFDRKGKTRFYAVAGVSMNLIATAHYDLITKNNFRSSPPGSVPDKKTDSEVARIREHILDGAKFSSKSYVTVAAGFGVEHNLGGKLSLFAQPMYNYQVPYFSFSDRNGKQFQFISMQFGTRVRLR